MITMRTILALLLLTIPATAHADETPDHESRGGIVASEVHASPTVGPDAKDETVAIHATTRAPSCPVGWTLVNGTCLP